MHINKTHWDNIFVTVINLARDHDRRSYMSEHLRALGIPHSFLEATDGRTYDFSTTYDESIAVKKHGNPLTSPEKGCALSHRRALEMFLASGKPYGLIMEDDIAIDPIFPHAVLESIASREAKPWTYLQFNYSPVGWQGVMLWWFLFLRSQRNYASARFYFSYIKGLAANTISILWGMRDAWYRFQKRGTVSRVIRDQYLAGCYIVTREAAEAIVAVNTPLTYTADRVQNVARRERRIRHYVYIPRLVRQKRESFSSSINNEHFGKKVISY